MDQQEKPSTIQSLKKKVAFVKSLLSPIKRLLVSILGKMKCHLLLTFHSPKPRNLQHYFSICAIFKNEAPYFREWLEFHKLIGVDHIFLYNNFSTDNYEEILAEYIADGFVTLKQWPFEQGQMSAYEDCYNQTKGLTQWLMFLDLDEFICLKQETDVKAWIRKFEKYPSVILYWLMFGTNGITKNDPEKTVIEQYTHSWENVRNVGKIVLNTNFTPVKIYHHHIFCFMKFMGINIKIPMINENKQFIPFPGTEECPRNGSIQINHYWSKSLEEYIRKIDKGDVFSLKHVAIRKDLAFFYWHEHQNISENKQIWRFLIELKIRLQRFEFKL